MTTNDEKRAPLSGNGAHAASSRPTAALLKLRARFTSAEGDDVVAAAPAVPLREIFRYFWPFARPYKTFVFMLVALIVAVPLVQGARLYMIKLTADEVLIPKDTGPLVWLIPLTLGLTIVGGLLSYFHSYLSTWVGQSFLLRLRARFFAHLQGLSLDFFERRRLGDVLSRLTGDLAAIEQLFLSGVAESLSALVRVVFFAGALFVLSWKLAFVTFLIAPVFALIVRIMSRRLRVASREKRRRTGALTAIAEESLSNAALVQAYNRQPLEVGRFERQNEGAFEATMIGTRIKAMLPPVIDVVQAMSGLLVLGVGTVELQNGNLTVGGLALFVVYLNQLYSPMRYLANIYNLIFSASAGAERVIEVFEEKPTVVDREDAGELPSPGEGRVEFDAVSLVYPGTDRSAVDEVTFTAEPGETIALVGHSGAGKTTLAKLLLRFYDPNSGTIRIDGTDISTVRLDSLRDSVAVLLQETLIFEGTIRENILYGRPEATEEEIVGAAQAAQADEFIQRLPDGYDTLVGQKGRRLSGGERQRVAIARAMIRDSSVLILDEPTTGLDAESTQRIMEPLRRLMQGRTTIVISHNLMTVRDADSIVVLEHGRVIERGTHDELLSGGGTYAKLCRLQEAASYARLAEIRRDMA